MDTGGTRLGIPSSKWTGTYPHHPSPSLAVPGESGYWLAFARFSPSHWRLSTLAVIRRPGFCSSLIKNVKRHLHGRFRLDLRRQISATTCAREALREQGKLKKVLTSILHKDTELYALHSLQVEQGVLTVAPSIYNLVTEHFTDWYRSPGPPPDWPVLLSDRAAFQALADSKLIPPHLTATL